MAYFSTGRPNYTPPPPPPKPNQYGGSTSVPDGSGSFDDPDPFKAPDVPAGKGGGSGTQVDTPSLDLFADRVGSLIDPITRAQKTLQSVAVHPGDFYHANKMRTDLNGPNEDDGLKEQYVKVLSDLRQGINDLQTGVHQLSTKYKSIEDANKMSASDLQNAFQSANGDFNSLITDAGGTPAVPSNSGGTPPSTSGAA